MADHGMPPIDYRDPITEQVVARIFRERAVEGRRRFGGPMSANKMSPIELVNEAIEEAVDLCVYLQAVVRKLEDAEPCAVVKNAASTRVENIVEAVSGYSAIGVERMRGRGRQKATFQARSAAMYLIREMTGWSLSDIGEYFDRDHTSVIYAIRQIEDALTWETSGELHADLVAMREQIALLA